MTSALRNATRRTVTVGDIHLRVADLDRAFGFYQDALEYEVVADLRSVGVTAAYLGADDHNHHIGLNSQIGLSHVAFVYSDLRRLARAVRRLVERGYPIEHASDDGTTVSVFLDDPDGNGVELYYDRPATSDTLSTS
jgi:catechol 2,3-dioxygenase